ncbi:MAG: hypothetical protein ACKVQK_03070 [Burkholderiales bacterium]
MPNNRFAIGILWLWAAGVHAQFAPPVNDLPNPYKTVAPWGALPEGRSWGTLSAVTIDNDGESLWVAYRCGTNPDTPPGGQPSAFIKSIG